MQAGTHLAGAVLTLAVARGLGLEVGPLEAVACAVGSLLPDVDTTTSGPGRFARPLARVIESRFGHRTLTHGLLFLALLALALWWPLRSVPGVWFALVWGYLSHLLLDTLNTNGVPLLWPLPLRFWMFAARSMRVKYGSPQEITVAVCCAALGVALWPASADGFDTAIRRVIATPDTAVMDFLKWHETREVWADLEGFNSDTQEPLSGRFRVVEALGRAGVLVEDQAGNLLSVKRDGQIVSYRLRAYPGDSVRLDDARVGVSGRLLRDVLAGVPKSARAAWFTGELTLSNPVTAPAAPVGTVPRVRAAGNGLTLELARPADLARFASSYVVTGSLVVRTEYGEGAKDAGTRYTLPPEVRRAASRTIHLDGLPSLAGLLVEQGAEVLEGQPLARFVDTNTLADLDAGIGAQSLEAARARAEVGQARAAYEQQRDALTRELAALRPEVERTRFLVSQDAEPRRSLEVAQQNLSAARERLTALSVDYSARAADARARADGLAVQVADLKAKRQRTERAQLVRSPVAGRVAEVRVKDATAAGVAVDIILITGGQ